MAEASRDPGAVTMQERLQRRHQARAEDAERRKEAKESRSVVEEQGEYFRSSFDEQRANVQQLLAGASGASGGSGGSGGSGPDRTEAARLLEEATSQTLQLQRFLNDSTLFLTQYELRRAQAALQDLQASLSQVREEALPRKKFAFRARAKATDKAPGARAPSPEVGAPKGAAAESEQCGFSHLDGVCVTRTAEEIQKRDVLLTHLTNCKVRLLGSPSTLHLKHIHSCEILCGPVSSSVFVDHCTSSTLAVPCQQLRTHNTTDTRVYLHVTSRAIIEDCRGVSFAPFTWSYPTLDQDFDASGLDRGRNNWDQVDDFNWLAAGTQSPNWSVIPEEDRRTDWDL